MPAYLFIETKIHDPEQYSKYIAAVRELGAKWKGRYIVRSLVHVVLAEELPPPPGQAVGGTG